MKDFKLFLWSTNAALSILILIFLAFNIPMVAYNTFQEVKIDITTGMGVNKTDVLDIAREVSEARTYQIYVYDCRHYAEDYRIRLLNELGISSVKMITRMNCSVVDCSSALYHMIVKVPYNGSFLYIDPTAGWEITKDVYYIYGWKYAR